MLTTAQAFYIKITYSLVRVIVPVIGFYLQLLRDACLPLIWDFLPEIPLARFSCLMMD